MGDYPVYDGLGNIIQEEDYPPGSLTRNSTVTIINMDNTAALVSFDDAKQGRILTGTWKPDDDAPNAVNVLDFWTMNWDTSDGDVTAAGHGVIDYRYVRMIGGGTFAQGFVREVRATIKDGTTGGYLIVDKVVLEPDTETDGTLGNLILRQISDYSNSGDAATYVSWIDTIITDDIQDPRALYKTAGGILQTAGVISTSTYTAKVTDSGKSFICFAGVPVTITVPADLPPGWNASYVNGDNNRITIAAGAGGALINASGHTKSGGAYTKIDVEMIAAGYVLLTGQTAAA